MSTDHTDKADAIRFFEELELKVESIAPGQNKRPDLLVSDSPIEWLVEIKRRNPCLNNNMIEWSPDGAIFSRAGQAETQFKSYDPSMSKLRLLWISINAGHHTEQVLENIQDTFFGVKSFFVPGTDGHTEMRKCLRAQDAVFDKSPSLTGAIIATSQQYAFIMNENHCEYSTALRTKLLCKIQSRGATLMTQKILKDSGFLIYEGPEEYRGNDDKVAANLKLKYGLPAIIPSTMKTHKVQTFLEPPPTHGAFCRNKDQRDG